MYINKPHASLVYITMTKIGSMNQLQMYSEPKKFAPSHSYWAGADDFGDIPRLSESSRLTSSSLSSASSSIGSSYPVSRDSHEYHYRLARDLCTKLPPKLSRRMRIVGGDAVPGVSVLLAVFYI